MKSKRVLITYLDNGNMASQVSKEMMFNSILKEMLDDGREVVSTTIQPKSKSAKFTDGSSLMLFPLGINMAGIRATHVYADQNILDLPNGSDVYARALRPLIITGDLEKFDTEGKQLNTFSFEDGELIIK